MGGAGEIESAPGPGANEQSRIPATLSRKGTLAGKPLSPPKPGLVAPPPKLILDLIVWSLSQEIRAVCSVASSLSQRFYEDQADRYFQCAPGLQRQCQRLALWL